MRGLQNKDSTATGVTPEMIDFDYTTAGRLLRVIKMSAQNATPPFTTNLPLFSASIFGSNVRKN